VLPIFALQGLTAAVAADCLGMRNLASNYAMLQLAPAVSSYALAEVMFSWVYKYDTAVLNKNI
jgi:hypothetical protein